nr:YIP1 family protein [Calditrichia bacterium]
MEELLPRFLRAITLRSDLYEEVERDPNTLTQALVVLVWSGLARGVGRFGPLDFGDIFRGLGISIGSYVIWAALAYGIGTTILKGRNTQTSFGELLRVLGFASAPGVFCLFG